MQKILVIDDDRDMCLLLKRFLSKHGFEIEDANTAKKALELLDATEYDLVLCDFRLDNMDGKTMLVKIKEKYPHMPVIIITGYSDIKIAVEVMKLGAFDYITKPLFPDEIILTIRKALEKSDNRTLPRRLPPLPHRMMRGRRGRTVLSLTSPSAVSIYSETALPSSKYFSR